MNLINKSENFDYEVEFCKEQDLKSELKKEAKFLGFKFEEATAVHLRAFKKVFVNICDETDLENFKIGSAEAYCLLKDLDIKSVKVTAKEKFLPAIVEGFLLSSYNFTKYKSKPKDHLVQDLIIQTNDFDKILEVQKVCDCVNFARDIVNSHPEEIYPKSFVEHALKAVKDLDIKAKILGQEELEKENMNAFLAVNRASRHEPRLLHLTYKPKNAKKKIVLVGKGLTYDSGGLSLKPSDYMLTMKSDKSGATAVVATIIAAAKLGINVEIHAIAGLAENMIGGNAYKPDDVLVARNKTTIEVKNTDAEGRLVLADCLDYASELKPDILIDLATLTGACVVGVGDYTIGVMGNSDELKEKIFQASKQSGELVANLPFNRYLKKLIKSDVADISNASSKRQGGAITAGLFLENFVSKDLKDKWVHLDIAGPAFVDRKWGYNPVGASGAGVRLLVALLKNIA